MGNVPSYYLSIFVAPEGVVEKLEKIRRTFLWGGSEGKRCIYWVSWDKVIASKEDGGLGVSSIKSLNISLIMKWWWRLRSEPAALWANAIINMHNFKNKPDLCYANKYISGTWKNIASIGKHLQKKDIPIDSVISKEFAPTGTTWKCHLTGDETYSVNVLRKKLDFNLNVNIGRFTWLKEVPIKVNCFIWRAKLG